MALVVRQRTWLARLRPHLGAAGRFATVALFATFLASGGLTRTHWLSLTVGHTVLAAASGTLILMVVVGGDAARSIPLALLSRPLIRLFGRRSYAIYLFHHPVNFFFSHRVLAALPGHGGLARMMALQGAYLVVGCFSLLGGSIVFERIFERPILRLKHFFAARPGGSTHGEFMGR